MLQNIRDKSQGWLAGVVVAALIATFALWGIHSYVTNAKNISTPAKVGSQVITLQTVNAVYERLRQQRQLQLGANFSMSQADELRLKRAALQQLVVSSVLTQAAYKAGYRVTTGQVDEALLQIPAFEVNGQFSIDRFHEILGGILYTQDQFLADMRQAMLINQVQGGYVNSAFALPGEVDTAMRLVNQKRDISYMIIPAARFAKQVSVSSQEVKDYYQTHQNEFQSPEQVSLDYLELSLPEIKSRMSFDASKLQQYYENNLQNYTQPASWHVAHILIKLPKNASSVQVQAAQQKAAMIEKKLKAGGDFAALARQYSDDSASAARGGELDWFSAGTLDPAFEKAVAGLQQPGQTSAPVRTAYGLNIIQLLGEKKAQVLPFATVKDQVQNALAEQQAQQIFTEESDKLANLTYANPDSLDVAAKALNLSVQQTGLFDREGGKTGLIANPHVIIAAFSPDVLLRNNNSDVIQLDPNTVMVIRIKAHKPAAVLPFADVQNTIQAKLANQKARQQAEQLGHDLLAQLRENKVTATVPATLAKKYALSWQIDKNAGRYDSRVDLAILTKAFRMPHPLALHAPTVAGLKLSSGDYAVIMLNAVYDGDVAPATSVPRRIFTEQVETNLGHMDYELYARELMRRTKVHVNQAALMPGNANDAA